MIVDDICRCEECRAGDELPVELQGIPGARQIAMLPSKHRPRLRLIYGRKQEAAR